VSAQVVRECADFISMITGHAMDDLLAVVGRERQVLERLLYRLIQTSSLLNGDETRFLHWLALDLERVAEHLHEIDLQRSIIAVGVQDLNPDAHGLPLPDTMTLIASNAPTPYRFLLDDHQEAMRTLVGEIGVNVAHIRDLVRAKLASIASYATPRGRRPAGDDHHDGPAHMDALDREILSSGYGAVLNACDRLQLPELVRFLDC